MTVCRHRQATSAIPDSDQEVRLSRDALRQMALDNILECEDLRMRITQALHDEVGQALTVLNLHLFWLSRHCPGKAEIRDKIMQMQQTLSSIHRSIALIARECRPIRPSADAALADIIECLVRQFRISHRRECALRMPDSLPAIPDDFVIAVSHILARCLDALAACKMSGGLVIDFGYSEGWLTIEIRDGDYGVRESSADAGEVPAPLGVEAWIGALGGRCNAEVAGIGEYCLRIALPLPRDDVRGA